MYGLVGHPLRTYALEDGIKSSSKDATRVIVLMLPICITILSPSLSPLQI